MILMARILWYQNISSRSATSFGTRTTCTEPKMHTDAQRLPVDSMSCMPSMIEVVLSPEGIKLDEKGIVRFANRNEHLVGRLLFDILSLALAIDSLDRVNSQWQQHVRISRRKTPW